MKIKFSNSAIIAVILICMAAGAVQAKKFCEGNKSTTDGFLFVTTLLSFNTIGDDCCTPTAGSAFVSKHYFFNDLYLGYNNYYLSIAEAQYSIGCEYT